MNALASNVVIKAFSLARSFLFISAMMSLLLFSVLIDVRPKPSCFSIKISLAFILLDMMLMV